MVSLCKFNFPVGGIASGSSFIGRQELINNLSNAYSIGEAVHLVGATRIGKSSLIRRVFNEHSSDSNVIQLELCLSEFTSAFHFWYTLCQSVLDGIRRVDPSIWTPFLEMCQDTFDRIPLDNPPDNWYIRLSNLIGNILIHIGKMSWRVVLAIDEFDAVTRVFAGEPSYYQLLRSLFSDSKYALNGFIISRRNLSALEAKVPDISTFHGVFRRVSLTAFNESDMKEFYDDLRRNGIELNEQAKELFFHYTGYIPYLCCLFAQYMSEETTNRTLHASDINAIVKEKSWDIDQYYKDLTIRLKEDGHLESIVYLAFDDMRTHEYYRNRENMVSMGLLSEIYKDGQKHFYAYSEDFMIYLRFLPDSLPIKDLMCESEKQVKRILGKEYPVLEIPLFDKGSNYTCETARQKLIPYSGDIRINFEKICANGEKLVRYYDAAPTILDVLNFSFVINIICGCLWDKHFGRYFDYDESWKKKLHLISQTRNPIAHASEKYISDDILCDCKHYCEELLKLGV